MNGKKRNLIQTCIYVLLLALAIYAVNAGKTVFGIGLMAAVAAVLLVRYWKNKKLAAIESQGMKAVDERTWIVAGKAAYGAYTAFALTAAVIVLVGSVFGPVLIMPVYDTLGLTLAGLVFLYTGFYYYYDRRM